jgi:LuxR family maltose regulon positive regulatory protein
VPDGASGASAALTRAALALAEHDLTQCSAALEQAQSALETAGVGHPHPARLAHACLAAIAASLGPDQELALDLVTAADVALGLAAEEGAGHPSADLVGLVAGARARVMLLRGDFAVAARALEAGVRATDGTRLTALHQDLQGMGALVAAVSGQLRSAAQTTHRLLARADDAGAPRSAVVALAWIRMDEYSLVAVDQLLDSARGRGGGFDSRLLSVVQALLQARLETARGHLAVARAGLLAAASANPQFGAGTWLGRALLAEQASTHLAQDQPRAALAVLEEAGLTGPDVDLEPVRHRALRLAGLPIPDLATPPTSRLATWPLERQLSWAFMLAEQAERHEDHVAAMELLVTAVRHAAIERLRRPFLEAEGPVLEFIARAPVNLTRWLRVPDTPGSPTARPSTSAGTSHHATDDLLTRKEAEVLGYLSILLTTDEIAEAMFVSVNTVRSHVRSVLRKLEVTRRNDAVRRAWDLGLIPRPVLGPGPGGGISSPTP